MRPNRPRNHIAGPIAFLIGLTTVVALAGCGSGADASEPKAGSEVQGIKLLSPGQLTVCTHLSAKPFEYPDTNGKIIGFDVELMDVLAKKLGVEQKIVDIDFSQITSGAAFIANKCDAGMGSMTITPERAKVIAFSDPYFDANQSLLVKTTSSIQNLGDMKGKKLGVKSGTTGAIFAQQNASKYGYTILSFDDVALELNAVKTGQVAGSIADNPAEFDFVRNNPDTRIAIEFDTGKHYGFAVKKNDANAAKLLTKMNEAIASAKADGSYTTMFKKYFGTTPEKIGS